MSSSMNCGQGAEKGGCVQSVPCVEWVGLVRQSKHPPLVRSISQLKQQNKHAPTKGAGRGNPRSDGHMSAAAAGC